MQRVEEIALSKRTSIRLRMRGLYNLQTRGARGGQELYWQQKLTKLDPELHLRWNYLRKHWSVYYDHHGMLSTIATFGPNDSFGKVYLNLKHNAYLDTRRLRQMKKEYDEQLEADENRLIEDCAEEFAIELHHSTKERVINDSVDAFATPKLKLGEIRI
jgi:hypothetical protein